MQFNDTVNKSGIIQDIEFWLFASNYGQVSGNNELLQMFTSLCNSALDSTTNAILEADDRWQYDDTNYTDYPIATTGMVANQRDYVLSVEHLKITRVEAKDDTGTWYTLQPIDLADIGIQARDEFFKEPGKPWYYDKLANSLFLYPAPDYTQLASLRVYYQREPSYFNSADTIKEPGFMKTLHRLVPIKASLDYAVANNLTDKITVLTSMVQQKELELRKAYQRRNKDERLMIRTLETPSY